MEESKKSAITGSFSLFTKSKDLIMANVNTYAFLFLLPFAIEVLTNYRSTNITPAQRFTGTMPFVGITPTSIGVTASLGLLIYLLNFIVTVMLYGLNLESTEGKKPQVPELWNYVKKYGLNLFLLTIATGVIIAVGLIALIIPGILLIGRLYLAPYVMIDKNLGIVDALKESNRISKSHSGYVWGVILVTIVLTLPILIPFFGWVVAFALTSLYAVAPALRYKELVKLEK